MDTTIETIRSSFPKFIINPNPKIYLSNNYVVLDFETTNKDYGSPYNKDNSLVCGGWILGSAHPDYRKDQKFVFHWGNEFEFQQLVEVCEKADFIVAHNSKFELGWLERCGLDISRVLPYCTQIGEYVLAGNRKCRLTLNHSLNRYGLGSKLEIISTLMDAGVCPSEMPMDLLEEYGRLDIWQTHRLFLRQRRKLNKAKLLPAAFTRNIFTPALVEIEQNGMHLEKDRVLAVYHRFMDERNQLQIKLDKITGGVNFRSGKQMAELLYRTLKFKVPVNYKGDELVTKPTKDWPNGKPKTDKDTIAKLKARNKVQQEFLDTLTALKQVDSSITKFIGKMAACVEETDDHILYASMNQTTTATHRLSSSGLHYKMQFQNFDRRFKPLFGPRHKGWSFGEADEAQLEYRTAVFLGDDEVGLQDIIDKVDAHSITAAIIFKEQWEECGGDKKSPLGKYVRTEAKSHTFKPLYGGSSGTPREQEYYQFFKDKHQGIAAIQQEWIDTVYRTRKLRTCTGLIYYWEDAKMNRHGKLIRPDGRPADQSICNYPVQGLATAEIVPIGVTYLYHYMKASQMESFLVNTVHDSALAEIHPDERELFSQFAVQSMEKEVYHYLEKVYSLDFYVPLEAEVTLNNYWSNSPEWEAEYLKVA